MAYTGEPIEPPNLWYLWFLIVFVILVFAFICACFVCVCKDAFRKKDVLDPVRRTGSRRYHFEQTHPVPEIRLSLLTDEDVAGSSKTKSFRSLGTPPPSYDIALFSPKFLPDNRVPSYEDVMSAKEKTRIKRLSA